MTTARDLPPRFDALDPSVLDDPYPRYAELRAHGPLCRGGPGTWMVTRYAEVSALLAHPALVHRLPAGTGRDVPLFGAGAAGELSTRMLSALEPPEHTAVRRLLHQALGPSHVATLQRTARAATAQLLDPHRDGGEFDLVADVAFPLQARVVSALVGLDEQDQALVWPAAMELGRTFIPYRIPSAEQIGAADAVVLALRARLSELLDQRAVAPRADLLSAIAAAVAAGTVPVELALDNLVFLCFAGFETTMNVVGSIGALLPRHPGQWARLVADRSLVGSAVDELLRYDSPAQYTIRLSGAALDVGGRTVRPGRMVLLMMGSANRDERQFADPDRLDVGRRPNRHVSFGGGPHHCVGRALGRTVCETALAGLLDRFAELDQVRPPVRSLHANFRAHASVPLRGRPH